MAISSKFEASLVEISHRLLDDDLYPGVESLANLLTALRSGRWDQLPDDEKLHWVRQLAGLLGAQHGLSSYPEYCDWPLLQELLEAVGHLERKLERRLSF